MDIKALKPRDWKPMVSELEERFKLNEVRFSRIIRVSGVAISIEGGKLQYVFNMSTGVLHIWGGASRHAGASVTIRELQVVEEICKAWVDDIKENL